MLQSGYSCAVNSAAAIVCWGNVDVLRGGVAPAGAFSLVSAGIVHACALRLDETIACWGYDQDGEASPPAGTFTALSACYHGSCAIAKSDRRLVCWPGTPGTQPPAPAAIPAARAFALPSAKACVSRRRFTIRVRKLPGVTWVSAVVTVRGRRVRTLKGARITAPVNLTGLPKGRYTVSIRATTSTGVIVTGTRTYRTCARRRASPAPPL